MNGVAVIYQKKITHKWEGETKSLFIKQNFIIDVSVSHYEKLIFLMFDRTQRYIYSKISNKKKS